MIEDGSILIRDRRIVSVGPTRRIENLKEARNAVDVPVQGCVMMPGFVDPAIHVSLYSSPATAESAAKRKKGHNFFEESLALVRACLQHGTLNVQLKVHSETGAQGAAGAALRQLAELDLSPVGTVRSLRLSSDSLGEQQMAALAAKFGVLLRRGFAQNLELPASPDMRPSSELWESLSQAGIPLNLNWAGGPAHILAEFLKRAHPRCVFCPAELSAAEAAVLAPSPAISVFSPCKELLEERENPSAKKMAEAGGAIALASGYDAKDAPIFSMQMVAALAVLRLRLSVEQAIVATTINAAHAVGLGDEVGSLEAGKRADILVLNMGDYREIPRRLGVNQVMMALRDGNFLINRKRAKASV